MDIVVVTGLHRCADETRRDGAGGVPLVVTIERGINQGMLVLKLTFLLNVFA